jgi:hypothetical protein
LLVDERKGNPRAPFAGHAIEVALSHVDQESFRTLIEAHIVLAGDQLWALLYFAQKAFQ